MAETSSPGAIGLSVIVPVYNCELYLERCLKSLHAQTLQDMEFIIIDDGSTDRSAEIIDRFAAQDPRFVVIHKENSGVASARNVGLDKARGEYLGFVDADDYAEPDCFEELYQRAKADDADLVACNYYITRDKSETLRPCPLPDRFLHLEEFGRLNFYLAYYTKEIALWNHLIRTALVQGQRIRFEAGRSEDALFHLRLLPVLTRISFVAKPFYHYVQRPGSITHKRSIQRPFPVTFLQRYVEQPLAPTECGRISPLAQQYFVVMLACCLIYSYGDAPASFFFEQIGWLRRMDCFEGMCRALCRSDELEDLYRQRAMTQRMYRVQRAIFSQCLMHRDRWAAWLMWAASRYMYAKRWMMK